MIQLIQFPWSPYCLVIHRILQYSRAPFTVTDIPSTQRDLVWKLTRQQYYAVPIIKDGSRVIYEETDTSQTIARYLDTRFHLQLFPPQWDGIQQLLWKYIEDDIEALTFKLNDIHWHDFVPPHEQLAFLRHKERKFGRGCIQQWTADAPELLGRLSHALEPCERMLQHRPYLLDDQPRFLDFDLYGMLANFLYSAKYRLPSVHRKLNHWYQRISQVQIQIQPTQHTSHTREKKLRSRHQRPPARPKLAAQIRRK